MWAAADAGGAATGTDTPKIPLKLRTAHATPHHADQAAAKITAAFCDLNPTTTTADVNERVELRKRQRHAPEARADPTKTRHAGAHNVTPHKPRAGAHKLFELIREYINNNLKNTIN